MAISLADMHADMTDLNTADSRADSCHTDYSSDQFKSLGFRQIEPQDGLAKTLAQMHNDSCGQDAGRYMYDDDSYCPSNDFLQCHSPKVPLEEDFDFDFDFESDCGFDFDSDFDFDFDSDFDFLAKDPYSYNVEQTLFCKPTTNSKPFSIGLQNNAHVDQTYKPTLVHGVEFLTKERTQIRVEQPLPQSFPFEPTKPTKRKRVTNTFAIRQETRRWHCTGKTKAYVNHVRSDGEWTECPNEGCFKLIKWDSKNNLKCKHCKSEIQKRKQANQQSAGLHWRWVRCAAENCKAMYIFNRGKRLRRSADRCRLLNSCRI